MNVTMCRDELCRVLEVTESGLKSIVRRDNLNERLKTKGFDLIKSYKYKNNTLYEVEPIEADAWGVLQNAYRIKKKEEHTKYSELRLTKGMDEPRRKFVKDNEINISQTTAGRYDDILIKEKAMEKNSVVYMMIDSLSESFEEITEEEYTSFWKDVGYCKKLLGENRTEYKRYEISEETYEYRASAILNQIGREKGFIAIKFNTYKEAENTMSFLNKIKLHKARVS